MGAGGGGLQVRNRPPLASWEQGGLGLRKGGLNQLDDTPAGSDPRGPRVRGLALRKLARMPETQAPERA